jgi:tetratricopeptide (TPR) repeat protein
MSICRHFPHRWDQAWRRTAGAALVGAGLAITAARGQEPPPEPVAVYHAPTDPGELLKVDEPMRRYFGERMRPHGTREDQLRALVESILRPDWLNFTYDGAGTFDARETFRQRRGNCVSFAFLFVAVARDFGFKASFQNVATPERWDRYDKLIVSFRHMNVRVETVDKVHYADLRPDLFTGTGLPSMQVISDQRAIGEFYDTVGFYELLRGHPEEGLRYMTLATTIDPSFAAAWSNRASVLAGRGKLVEARACFEHSLRADPKYLFALDGYVDVLRRLGSPEDLRIAAKYEHRAQEIRERNPYYHQHLAARALEQGDLVAAEKHLRRALSLKDNEPEFHEQLVTVLLQLGRTDDARRANAKLEKLRQRLALPPPPLSS